MVVYSDADGDAPSYVRLVLDGVQYDMNLVSGGSDFRNPATYSFSRTLVAGTFSYYFATSDGVNDAVQTQQRSIVVDPVEVVEGPFDFFNEFMETSYYGFSGMLWLVLIVLVLVGLLIARGGKGKGAGKPNGETPAGETIIDCPSCGSKLQVNSPERPLEIECPTCQTQLKIT